MLASSQRAEVGSLQGAHEFYTEIELLSRVHHKNLVKLVGYCLLVDESEQVCSKLFLPGPFITLSNTYALQLKWVLLNFYQSFLLYFLYTLAYQCPYCLIPVLLVLQMLVYEFMPGGTLRDHLKGRYDFFL